MDDNLLRFVLEGTPDRNGNIPADVFLTKLRQFIATMYSFDRAFARKAKRSVELEVVDLKRVNPAIVAFRPKSQVGGYDAHASMSWTMEQLGRIHDTQTADISIPQDALDNIIDLARIRDKKLPSLIGVRVEYGATVIDFDARMEGNALALRSTREIAPEDIWHAGVSKGTLFGELRGVMDLNGERQFFITPPSGADKVQCFFPESMRQQMNDKLFQLVRVHGYLRYDGTKPTPFVVEAERLEGVPEQATNHFSELLGAFREYEMPETSELA